MASDNIAYGYKRPNMGDRLTWWTDWLFNFDRLSTHKHDGIDSAKISSSAIARPTDLILPANWVNAGFGYYTQTVICPAGVVFPQAIPQFYIEEGPNVGAMIHPGVTKLTDTSYQVKVNDNTLKLRVVYA